MSLFLDTVVVPLLSVIIGIGLLVLIVYILGKIADLFKGSSLANLDLGILIESEFKARASFPSMVKYQMSGAATKKKMLDEFAASNPDKVIKLIERVNSGMVKTITNTSKTELEAVGKAASASFNLLDNNGNKFEINPIVKKIVPSGPETVGKVIFDMPKTVSQAPPELAGTIASKLQANGPVISAVAGKMASK